MRRTHSGEWLGTPGVTIANISLNRADFSTRSDSVVQLKEGDALTYEAREIMKEEK